MVKLSIRLILNQVFFFLKSAGFAGVLKFFLMLIVILDLYGFWSLIGFSEYDSDGINISVGFVDVYVFFYAVRKF